MGGWHRLMALEAFGRGLGETEGLSKGQSPHEVESAQHVLKPILGGKWLFSPKMDASLLGNFNELLKPTQASTHTKQK